MQHYFSLSPPLHFASPCVVLIRVIGVASKIMLFYILISAMMLMMITISTKPLPARHLDVLNSVLTAVVDGAAGRYPARTKHLIASSSELSQ